MIIHCEASQRPWAPTWHTRSPARPARAACRAGSQQQADQAAAQSSRRGLLLGLGAAAAAALAPRPAAAAAASLTPYQRGLQLEYG